MQRMNTLDPALGPVDMQATIPEIDMAPSQGTEFSRSQSMSVTEQNSASISSAIPSSLACSLDQSIHFLLSQIFPYSVG
jgi:hypothetical protein